MIKKLFIITILLFTLNTNVIAQTTATTEPALPQATYTDYHNCIRLYKLPFGKLYFLALSAINGITKGIGLIRTSGKTGLDKYNDFVKKMGNYQGRSKKEMGILYQKNKELNKAVSTNKSMDKCLSISSQFKEED